MMKWFHWSNFLDTYQEWHALIIGWADGVSFTKTDWSKIAHSCPHDAGIEGEYHYYKVGVALGRFSIIGFIAAMIGTL